MCCIDNPICTDSDGAVASCLSATRHLRSVRRPTSQHPGAHRGILYDNQHHTEVVCPLLVSSTGLVGLFVELQEEQVPECRDKITTVE